MLTKLRCLSREIIPVHLYGNVSIDPTAVIAPGVLLQADGNSRVSIGAGVCIGAGSIVRATGGDLEIMAGVCLGREVLIFGTGLIDRDACIGAGTTSIDPRIEEGAVIPPHSLLGDLSRGEVSVVEDRDLPDHLNDSQPLLEPPTPPENDTADPWDNSPVNTASGSTFYKVKTPVVVPPPDLVEQPIPTAPVETAPSPPIETAIEYKPSTTVAGRVQFDRIKRSLFPNSGNNDYTA